MTWITDQARHLTGGRIEICEAGHDAHRVIVTSTVQGPMVVFNASHYRDQPGYCTGDDAVSRSLIAAGHHEEGIRHGLGELGVLDHPNGDLVLDFGTHVGWYTLMAAQAGFDVLGFDGEPEHLTMVERNMRRAGVAERVTLCRVWLDEDTPQLDPEGCPPIRLLKADVEGAEEHVLRIAWPLIDAGLVTHLLLEISPVFNDSYPALVARLVDKGYTVHRFYPTRLWDGSLDFPQTEMLFSRC